MSQYQNTCLDEYIRCGGPRPPVPGKESRRPEMIEAEKQAAFKWAESLPDLLNDPEGLKQFRKYAKTEGDVHHDRIDFYFACEGLKQQKDPETIKKLVQAMYTRYIKKHVVSVSEEVRQEIKNSLRGNPSEIVYTFYNLQPAVLRFIEQTTYRNFLQSEMYVQILNGQTSSSSSSESISGEQSLLVSRSSTLPTLHEDSELHNYNSNFGLMPSMSGSLGAGAAGASIPLLTLTADTLMATQQRRLEMRPSRTQSHFVYTGYNSYNPVSCRDSELHSLSSGKNDSDTMSLSSTEGRLSSHRKYRSSERMEKRMMKESLTDNFDLDAARPIPRSKKIDPKEKLPQNEKEFLKILLPKLEFLQKQQEQNEKLARKLQEPGLSNDALAEAIREKFQMEDTNDQDILDQHVSRVWNDLTPKMCSPGAISPCPNTLTARRRPTDIGAFASVSNTQSMRHSKSMPEGATKKLSHKWPSINTDSGISLQSTDTLSKYKDPFAEPYPSFSRSDLSSGLSTPSTMLASDTRLRLQEEETRRSKRLPPPPPPPYQQQPLSLPPLPAKPQSLPSALQPPTASLQRPPQMLANFTIVVYSFCDEDVPYRIKIPGSAPTLRQFKEYLPKKGNYRFFFKTRCEDLDSPVIQEEINNDLEVLPLFEGKVMGTVKSAE